MKRIKMAAMCLATACIVTASGCGGKTGSGTKIRFWTTGDYVIQDAYKAVVDAYNKGQGKIDGVRVSHTNKADTGYRDVISQYVYLSTGPDVFMMHDRYLKQDVASNAATDLTSYYAAEPGDLELDSIWSGSVLRFRYNKDTKRSGKEESLWALPVDTQTTAIYYNKTAMEKAGIIVISVAASDLNEWNNNEIADAFGKKKSDYPTLSGISVPEKGYFRNDSFLRQSDDSINWTKPVAGTVLVFNEKIPMNWDEIEDLAFLLTKDENPDSATAYGYYTEWWFNYAWSVGGDCMEDVSNKGSWVFSLGDWTENYIIKEGKTYTGAYTGTVYRAGETLELLDKLDCSVSDKITADDKGGYKKNGQPLGDRGNAVTSDSATRPEVLEAVSDGTLDRLPSTREAFTRFTRLAGDRTKVSSSLDICPIPDNLTRGSSITEFTSGNVAMMLERSTKMPTISAYVQDSFEWGVAELPAYKLYENPTDAGDDTVKIRGKQAGHSETYGIYMRPRSEHKEEAWKFMRWLAGPEGQRVKAQYGLLPNQSENIQVYYDSMRKAGVNLDPFAEGAEWQQPGDWWYLESYVWIEDWAGALNTQLRNGNLSLNDFFNIHIKSTNEAMKFYGVWED